MAGLFAMHGHHVKVHDTNLEVLDKINERIELDTMQLYEEGFLEKPAFSGQILILSTVEEAVINSDFIFEAVSEDLFLKKGIFERISNAAPVTSIIASSTLTLNVNDLIKNVIVPERTMGVRFLYPVYFIPEVEISLTKCTAAAAIENMRLLLERMDKTIYFRSGKDPLILTEEQRVKRKQDYLKKITSVGYKPPNEVQLSTNNLQSINLSTDSNSDHFQSIVNDRECAICMNGTRDTLLNPCHHLVSCYSCARILICKHDKCPICRKQILDIVRVYLS